MTRVFAPSHPCPLPVSDAASADMRTREADPRRLTTGYAVYVTVLLTLLNICNFVDRMIFAVLVQPIKKDLLLTDTQIGLLSGFAFVAVYAAIGLPLARLADRVGRRWVLVGSVAVWSVMTGVCGLAHSFMQMAVARLGVGVGEAGCLPSSHAMLAEIYPPGRRIVPIAFFTAGSACGIAIGLSVGGALAVHYGWRAAFLVVGLPGIALAILLSLTLPQARVARNSLETLPSFRATIRTLAGIPTYRRTVLTHIFYLLATVGTLSWLPAFFMRTHGLTVKQAGLFFGLSYGFGAGIGLCVGAYVLQRASRDAPARSLHIAGWLALAALPAYMGALLIPSSVIALVLITLYATLIGGAGASVIAGQQGVVDSKHRATASALSMLLSSYLGGGLGPLLIGLGSSMLTSALGTNALRAALLVASAAIVLAGYFLIQASRSFPFDARS